MRLLRAWLNLCTSDRAWSRLREEDIGLKMRDLRRDRSQVFSPDLLLRNS
jgi:hypothetical protein